MILSSVHIVDDCHGKAKHQMQKPQKREGKATSQMLKLNTLRHQLDHKLIAYGG